MLWNVILCIFEVEKLIKGNFVDMHSHILPGLDDGSRNMEMSMRMMRIAWEEGIRTIIATPHNMPGKGRGELHKTLERIRELEEAARSEGIEITLKAGSELYYRQEIPELLERKEAVPMNGTNLVLVEFEPMNDTRYIMNALKDIINVGYTPIVAHIERYPALFDRKLDQIGDISELGCYIQVNASTISGKLGWKMKQYMQKLLKEELIDFVGTDAHSDGRRAPRIQECAKYLYKKCGKEYADSLLFGMAEELLL